MTLPTKASALLVRGGGGEGRGRGRGGLVKTYPLLFTLCSLQLLHNMYMCPLHPVLSVCTEHVWLVLFACTYALVLAGACHKSNGLV